MVQTIPAEVNLGLLSSPLSAEVQFVGILYIIASGEITETKLFVHFVRVEEVIICFRSQIDNIFHKGGSEKIII